MVSRMCGSPNMCVFLFLRPSQLLVWMEKNFLNQMGGKPLWFLLMCNDMCRAGVCPCLFISHFEDDFLCRISVPLPVC